MDAPHAALSARGTGCPLDGFPLCRICRRADVRWASQARHRQAQRRAGEMMMKRQASRSRIIATTLLLLAIATSGGAAERYKAPRTSWGDPLIEGVYTNNTNVPFERPKELGDKAVY